jgi:hypothetical protein
VNVLALRVAGLVLTLALSARSVRAEAPVVRTSTTAVGPAGDPVVVGEPHPDDWQERYDRLDQPDVDGRPPPPTGAGDVLIWVPRVLFSPLYLVTEFGIRRPLGALLTWVEKENIPAFFIDLFTFGEGRKVGLVPTAFIDFAFRPSFGVYFFANDAFVDGHELRITTAYGGDDWYKAFFVSRWRLGPSTRISFAFRFLERPDYIFHGIGPFSQQDDRSRYNRRFVGAEVGFTQNLWGLGGVRLTTEVEENQFEPSDSVFGDPSLLQASAAGFFELPPGIEGYFVSRNRLAVDFDTRRDIRENGTGLSVSGDLELGLDLNRPGDRSWLAAGSGLAGHLDLGHNRILSVAGAVRNVAALGDDPVPFSELVTSGQSVLFLSGFQPGRLTGNSVVAWALEYRYDVWALVDGRAFFSVGNVFGEGFDGFDPELLRINYGLGFASVGDPDASLNFLVAFGHETFRESSNLDSVRFVLGFQPDL